MDRSEFQKILKEINVELTDNQCDQFDKYYEILVEWNKVMNLTGITQYDEVLVKHFVDSLAVFKAVCDTPEILDAWPIERGFILLSFCIASFLKAVCELSGTDNDIKNKINYFKNVSVIDVGTGAGFPGVPIKIAFPETDVCLLDSLNKRVNFLNEVINQLGIKKVDAIHSRAEDGARNPLYREKYRIGVSRAVANLATLSEYVLPFVEPGGYFIAYKSGEIDEELEASKKAIGVLGGEIKHVYKFSLPGTDFGRSFVFIKKNRITPKKYPRKSGLPSKEPIK